MKHYLCFFSLGLILFIGMPVVAMDSEDFSKKHLRVQYGVSARQGDRSTMEDTHAIELSFGGNEDEAFVGLFDGHNGIKVARFAANDLCNNVAYLCLADQSFAADNDRLKNAFVKTENFLATTDYAEKMGSTALVAWFKSDKLIMGWLGDSRAVLADRQGKISWQSKDHKPNTPLETRRIMKSGGIIFQDHYGTWRVGKSSEDCHLSLSRALGDFFLKNELGNGPVSAEPDIESIPLTSEHAFLILGCDGVWDAIDSEQAVSLVQKALVGYDQKLEINSQVSWLKEQRRGNRLQRITEAIVEESNSKKALYAAQIVRDAAYAEGSTDNISVIVVLLDNIVSK